jgi:hypothetical protein
VKPKNAARVRRLLVRLKVDKRLLLRVLLLLVLPKRQATVVLSKLL